MKAFEINEAFAVVSLANNKILKLDPAIVNMYGGAVVFFSFFLSLSLSVSFIIIFIYAVIASLSVILLVHRAHVLLSLCSLFFSKRRGIICLCALSLSSLSYLFFLFFSFFVLASKLKSQIGVAAICNGGGGATAVVFEAL